MTTLRIIAVSVLFFLQFQLSAQESSITKESFQVKGNCDMCKSTIEKAAKSIDGVKSAKWNMSSKKMNVKYDSDLTSLAVIQSAIVASGYDLKEEKASDEAYNNLHKCCKYDRN